MIIAVPLMLMLAAAASAGSVGETRKAFSTCLSGQIQPGLDKKLSLADFQTEMKAKCADKEAAFRAAILADDKASGMNARDSQSDADDQVSEYVDKIASEYDDYLKPA